MLGAQAAYDALSCGILTLTRIPIEAKNTNLQAETNSSRTGILKKLKSGLKETFGLLQDAEKAAHSAENLYNMGDSLTQKLLS